jgi:hypothetical protein
MEDAFVVIIWFVIMGIVAVAKLVKRKGDAQEQQEQQEQQAYRRHLAQQQQQQQAGREQQRRPEVQHQQDLSEQVQHQDQFPRRMERQQGQRREPVSQDERHTTARKLIENAIEQQSSAARKHAETKPAAHPGDQKLPSLTNSIPSPAPSVSALRRKGQLRHTLSSKHDIRNAIILREVFDRPRAYDV